MLEKEDWATTENFSKYCKERKERQKAARKLAGYCVAQEDYLIKHQRIMNQVGIRKTTYRVINVFIWATLIFQLGFLGAISLNPDWESKLHLWVYYDLLKNPRP